MGLSISFKEYAKNDPASLDVQISDQMKELGYFFSTESKRDNQPWYPSPSANELIEALGGEEAIVADYDNGDQFTVTHIETDKTVISNSSISALAQLWIAIQA